MHLRLLEEYVCIATNPILTSLSRTHLQLLPPLGGLPKLEEDRAWIGNAPNSSRVASDGVVDESVLIDGRHNHHVRKLSIIE